MPSPPLLLTRGCALLVATLSLSACASERSFYVHPFADLSTVKQVAVLPLENMTTDRFAGERVREVITVELLSLGVFDVVDSGRVTQVLAKRSLASVTALGPEQIKQLGEDLDCQALLLGSVMEYRERRAGTFTAPEIALALRMVDVETGIVIWSVAEARTGLDVWTRLFGVGQETQTEAVRRLLHELLPEVFGLTATEDG